MKPTVIPFPHATRRGFTLLEVALAALLGSIVAISALALFTTMSRSQQRHEQRMQNALETTTAHRTITRAISSLLMHEGQEPREDELRKLREDDTRKAEGPDALMFDERALTARFSLQPSESPVRLADGTPSQILAVTLRAAPISPPSDEYDLEGGFEVAGDGTLVSSAQPGTGLRGGTRRELQAALLDDPHADPLMRVRARREQRQRERAGTVSALTAATKFTGAARSFSSEEVSLAISAAQEKGGSEKSGTTSASAQGASSGEGAPGLPAALAGIEQSSAAGRAPGVRGVFELFPDDPSVPQGGIGLGDADRIAVVEGAPLALWWRELPPINVDTSLTGDAANAAAADQAELIRQMQLGGASARRVKLLGGLAGASWRVFRNEKFLPKMSAKHAGELPAYVEFSFQTVEGRREDWLFEVAWSSGPEPGSALAAGLDGATPLGDVGGTGGRGNPGGGDGEGAGGRGDGGRGGGSGGGKSQTKEGARGPFSKSGGGK